MAQAQWRFDQKTQKAAQGSLVFDTLYHEDEQAGIDSPVARVLPPASVKMQLLVPQGMVDALRPGQAACLHYGDCAANINATVMYIATEVEYTPPVIYSNMTRDGPVLMVEAQPAAADGPKLYLGQPVEVIPP